MVDLTSVGKEYFARHRLKPTDSGSMLFSFSSPNFIALCFVLCVYGCVGLVGVLVCFLGVWVCFIFWVCGFGRYVLFYRWWVLCLWVCRFVYVYGCMDLYVCAFIFSFLITDYWL